MLGKGTKLHIRLPDDPGPNPYDSKTPIKDSTTPMWLTWPFWVSCIALGAALTFTRMFMNGGTP